MSILCKFLSGSDVIISTPKVLGTVHFVAGVAAVVEAVAARRVGHATAVVAAHLVRAASAVASLRLVAAVRTVRQAVAEPRRHNTLTIRTRELIRRTL